MLEKDLNKKKDNSKCTLPIIIICVLIGIVVASVFFMLNSNLFIIKDIKVINNKHLKKEAVIKKARIKKDMNIFKRRTKDIEKGLEKESFIKSVDIKRNLPNTLEINLTERKKIFFLKSTSFYLSIDKEGIILEHLKSVDEKLPIVRGFGTDSIKLGENIFDKEENSKLNTFMNEARKLKIISKMIEMDKDFANEIRIKFKNEIVVAFGTLDNVEYKLGLLKEILEDIEQKGIKNGEVIMNRGDHPILIIDD